MRDKLFKVFQDLSNNHYNSVVYFEGKNKVRKTWADMGLDIDQRIARLKALATVLDLRDEPLKVAIVGGASYEWMLIDLACIKGGFRSICAPETLPPAELEAIIERCDASFVLLDARQSLPRALRCPCPVYLFNQCQEGVPSSAWEMLADEPAAKIQENNILRSFSIGFSSGTSGNTKQINLMFHKEPARKLSVKLIMQFIEYKRSFWSRRDNKILIFMPFSHIQQRVFIRTALMQCFDIVLSSPTMAVQHLITEKPNVLISVPAIYEALSSRIDQLVARFDEKQKKVYYWFNRLGINAWRNSNPIKRQFSNYLFKHIAKVYGGRADFFVSGSAPVSQAVLETFFRVGVKIYNAYGQSELPRIIAMNTVRQFRLGSVGKPRVPIKISDEGEILVKIDESELDDKNLFSFDEQGYIHTGDIGYLDKDGFLFLHGRKDDVLVLDNGKKVFPNKIEGVLKETQCFSDVFVTSYQGTDISALVFPSQKTTDEAILACIRVCNERFAGYEKITQFHVLTTALSSNSEFVTGTQKIKRKAVKAAFENEKFTHVI